MSQVVTKNITAVDQFTDSVGHSSSEGDISVNISGTFAATLEVQRTLDGGATWAPDSVKYTDEAAFNIIPTEGAAYRLYCTAFTSGPVVAQLL